MRSKATPVVAHAGRTPPIEVSLDSIGKALTTLNGMNAPKPDKQPGPDPAKEFDLCAGPQTRTGPQFRVPFRRAVVFPDLCASVDLEGALPGDPDRPHPPLGPLEFNCARPTKVTFCISLDLRFQQVWNLTGISIGDLSSSIAFAPYEELTLEFQNTQRKVLETNRVDSAEEMSSTETTTIDKEVVNTVQSLTKTQEWHIDGSASYGIPNKLSIKAEGGFRRSTTETSQTTIDHVSEATNKSAHNLKTLHKIEVRGVSEGLVQNRMTRKIKNPYRDRTLSLNVFQLLKHFDVETNLVEVRPSFLIRVHGMIFDSDFVLSNTDFLRDKLMDPALVDDLPLALKGAGPLPRQSIARAREAAKLALHYLFDEIIIFQIGGTDNWPDLPRRDGRPDLQNPANSPEAGFDAGLVYTFPGVQTLYGYTGQTTVRGFPQGSALGDAVTNNLGPIFTALAYFYRVYRDMRDSVNHEELLNEHAIALTSAMAEGPGKLWTTLLQAAAGEAKDLGDENTTNKVLRNILDNESLTEIFRRLSGFVAMVNEMVKPIGGTPEAEQQAVKEQGEAFQALERLLHHLQCNNNYYTQQFLSYRSAKTNNQALFDFVSSVLDRMQQSEPLIDSVRNTVFGSEQPFIDLQQIIILGAYPLSDDQLNQINRALNERDELAFGLTEIVPYVLKDVQVPTDGVHLEVSKGDCQLDGLPSMEKDVEISIQGASLKASASGDGEGRSTGR